MRKGLLAVLFSLCLTSSALGATYNASTCERAEVQSKIDLATNGDTVTVPTGTCEWSSEVYIYKGITLQGGGSGYPSGTPTWIKQTINDAGDFLINYEPDSTAVAADAILEISGFKFDNVTSVELNNYTNCSGGIRMYSTQVTRPMRYKIHDNAFYDFYKTDYGRTPDRQYSSSIAPTGWFVGVVYDNYFWDAQPLRANGDPPYGGKAWVTWDTTPGSINGAYLEDNIIYNNTNPGTAAPYVTNGGWGGKFISRFNDIQKMYHVVTHGSHNNFDFIVHPNNPDSPRKRGTSLGEVYCNKFERATGLESYTNGQLVGAASGEWMVWGNKRYGSYSFKIALGDADGGTNIYQESTAPTVVSHGGTNYECKLNHVASAASEPGVGGSWTTYWKTGPWQTARIETWNSGEYYVKQPAYDTPTMYAWENKTSADVVVNASVTLGDQFFVANEQYWNYNPSFTGATGIGMGALASAPGTCTEGVGYWATDQGSWNQSAGDNILGYTGQGVLYKCGASNNWVAYYTPLTYPHPLRGQPPDVTAPVGEAGSPSGTLACGEAPISTTLSMTWTDVIGVTAAKCCDAGGDCTTSTDIDDAAMDRTLSQSGSTWSVLETGLSCDASYTYYCKAEDAANNESEALTISFSIDAEGGGGGVPVTGAFTGGVVLGGGGVMR